MAEETDKHESALINKLNTLVSDLERSGKLLIRRDLELTRANEKLRALDQAKSEFVSVAAHQLRTPLAGVKWSVGLLLGGDVGALSNEQKALLIKTYESNERMIALINDMLSADRAESGKQKFAFVPQQILNIVDSVVFEVLPLARKKDITLEFENRREDTPHVLIDGEKMRAVIQNLLENAVKYTMTGGRVSIGFREEGGSLIVSIKDTGIGISPQDQSRIFSRFFRGTNALKAETDGTGLGLFIAKSIVEKHGGKIWFESTEGVGSTFYFTIPLALHGESK